MSAADSLTDELKYLAESVGLLDGSGSLNDDWFTRPLYYVENVLSGDQLSALVELLDAVLPPQPVDGTAADEEWRPLLGAQPRGNVYLTTSGKAPNVLVGIAADFNSVSGPPAASLRARLPLIQTGGGNVTFVGGNAQNPFSVSLRVELDWSMPNQSIGLTAVDVSANVTFSPVAANGSITLEQLQIGSEAPADVQLDVNHLGPEAAHLATELARQILKNIAAPAGDVAAVANNLLPLFGLDGGASGIPAFPITQLQQDPAALQKWFAALTQDAAVLKTWIQRLSGLLGAAAGGVSGDGSPQNPWAVQLLSLGGGASSLDATAALSSNNGLTSLLLGVRSRGVPGGGAQPFRLEGSAILASIPLAGGHNAQVLPSASALLVAPADPNAPSPWISQGGFKADALRAGLSWDGSKLQPLLELDNVTLPTVANPYPRIDLTNTNSVASAAATLLENALINALGGTGVHLAVLAGLVKPTKDPASPHGVSVSALAANPAGAIASFHRSVLTDTGGHDWSHLLEEIGLLLGIDVSAGVAGAGTSANPWVLPLGTAGPLKLSLAAWNAQSGGAGADPQQLRIGVAAVATPAPITFVWATELLSFDLPQTGEGKVSLVAGQHLSFLVNRVPAVPPVSGISITADSFSVGVDWEPGTAPQWNASIANTQIMVAGSSVKLGTLKFPTAATLDFSNPTAVAAALGISISDLELALKTLLSRAAFSWGGITGFTLAGLFGLNSTLLGLQKDFPTISDPAGPGSLFSDPSSALRNWLLAVATQTSADGSNFISPLLAWLQALLANALPGDLATPPPLLTNPLSGSGVYDDPWLLPLSTTSPPPAEVMVWLDAAGGLSTPPATWAAGIAPQLAGAKDFPSLLKIVGLLAPFTPSLRDVLVARDVDNMAIALAGLEAHLSSSDGVVPAASQTPTGAHWTIGTPLTAPHHLLPSDASAITQINQQIQNWAGANKSVLLMGPAFGGQQDWQALITAAGASTADFNLRVPGVDPSTVDLSKVTAAAQYYTAELQDDGSGNLASLIAQIGHLVGYIQKLNGNQPVVLVAHSTAGVAAREFAATNPALIQGLITLGTPHAGAPLPFVTNSDTADAVRFLQALLPSDPGADPLQNALAHLRRAIDGYLPAAGGGLPTASPYPVDSFNFAGATHPDTGGPPTLALVSTLSGTLTDTLEQSLTTLATAAAGAAFTTPTHLGVGIRLRLSFPAPQPSDVQVDSWLRADAFQIPLKQGAPALANAAQALHSQTRISRPGGWLVGAAAPYVAPGVPQIDVRVRWAELGADITGGASSVQIQPWLSLQDGSYHAPIGAVSQLTDAVAQPLLGAILQTLSTPAPVAGSAADALLTALTGLGIAMPDPHGGIGISADAFAAINTDAAGFLAPRLQTALAATGGLAGITGPSAGPWTISPGNLPLQLYVSPSPLTFGVRTFAGTGLGNSQNASLGFDGRVQFPNLSAAVDASLNIGSFALTWSQASKTLTVASSCFDPIQIYPVPDAATLGKDLNALLPRLLFSSPASALVESLLPPGATVGPLDCLFSHTGNSASSSSALGDGSGGLSTDKLTLLLQTLNSAIGGPPGPGLSLPGNLQLIASGTGTSADPVTLQLATTADIAGILGFQAGLSFGPGLHVTPAGKVTLTVSGLGGTPWTSVVVVFQLSGTDVALTVTPTPGTAIQILPKFSGFGSLLASAEALLPEALDALLGAIPANAVVQAVLKVAADLNLYDAAQGFKGHGTQLQALLQSNWTSILGLTSTLQQQAATDLVGLLSANGFNTASDKVTASASAITWTHDLSNAGTGQGTIAVTLGWDAAGPQVLIGLAGFAPGNGALTADLTAGYQSGNLAFSLSASVALQKSLSLAVSPKFTFSESGGNFQAQFFPLATGTPNGPVTVTLAPTPGISVSGGTLGDVVEQILVPLAADVIWSASQALVNNPMWTAGSAAAPKVIDLLQSAGIISGGKLATPLPDFQTMVIGLIRGLADSQLTVPVTETLNLALVKDGVGRGVRLSGTIADIPVGSLSLSVLFGAPSAWGGDLSNGVTVYLLSLDSSPVFQPSLDLSGIGIGLSGQGDSALVNTDAFRLGDVRTYLFLHIDFTQWPPDSLGAGIELDALGLPLGQATGGGVGGNPVASSLLQSSGGGGDPHPINPGVDVGAWYRSGPLGDGNFHITFNAVENQPLWISVHAGFGPIYIDQIGLEPVSDPSSGQGVALLIDGTVKVDGLTVQTDELGVTIPFQYLTIPGRWTLDLKGLGVGFETPGITIAGALYKNDTGQAIEYDGLLLIQVTEFGFIAIGAYSTPGVPPDTYTSLFVFVAAFIPIGLPPVIDIEGLGLGVGYNRELLVPDDLNQIPAFPLVAALDNPGAFAENPMGELLNLGASMPAQRGSFWFAAGLHGTSFELVHVTAVLYIALDRGVEIGILGVGRMALPPDSDLAIVNIELALKLRFSTAEMVLSIQAQLTDNSYLLSPDCQLTGGFAYFMWFPQHQFVLTLGGYHPSFNKPPAFPDVPRLGFHWWLPPAISIKGEAYFALTNTCVMFGGRLEVSYGIPIINVWLHAYADVLVSWDPFYYTADIGVSIGASFSIQACVWGICVGVSVTVSVGASLALSGPPLHGEVSVNFDVASVTIAFGPQPNPQPAYLGWYDFRTKYLYGGDPNASAFAAHVLKGLSPPEPSGAQPSPGTQSQPWKLTTEFTLQTDTRMPAAQFIDLTGTQGSFDGAYQLDLAPMNVENVSSVHKMSLQAWDRTQQKFVNYAVAPSNFNFVPVTGQVSDATWHFYEPGQVPAAANTVTEGVGLEIQAHVALPQTGPPIPIGTLIDYGNPRPLPFASAVDFTTLHFYGTQADFLSAEAQAASSPTIFDAAAALVSGGGFFSQARAVAGLPAAGLPPNAVRTLRRRSSPPLLTPLTTGLTMKPVGLAAPPAILHVGPIEPVPLQTPRLRVALRGAPLPVIDAPAALRTSVTSQAASGISRMSAPAPAAIAGARLVRIPAANAPRPTALPHSGRTVRSSEIGWSPSVAQLTAAQQAVGSLIGDGVVLSAGATHIWDLTGSSDQALRLVGDPVRVTFLTRGGTPISDRELVPQQSVDVPIPAAAGMVALTGLGRWPANLALPAMGLGAVTFAVGPSNSTPAVGWQTANLVPQIGGSSLLARGAVVLLPQRHVPLIERSRIAQAMVRASVALRDQYGTETWLPPHVTVAMVLLDQQDATATEEGDFAIAASGASLATPPLRVVGGTRRALLYDVVKPNADAPFITISAASSLGWRLSGIVGLPGTAKFWAAKLNGEVPPHIVPDGPLTPDGQTRVHLITPAPGTAATLKNKTA